MLAAPPGLWLSVPSSTAPPTDDSSTEGQQTPQRSTPQHQLQPQPQRQPQPPPPPPEQTQTHYNGTRRGRWPQERDAWAVYSQGRGQRRRALQRAIKASQPNDTTVGAPTSTRTTTSGGEGGSAPVESKQHAGHDLPKGTGGECPICLQNTADTAVLPCLHTFCAACFEAARSEATSAAAASTCPVCQGPCGRKRGAG